MGGICPKIITAHSSKLKHRVANEYFFFTSRDLLVLQDTHKPNMCILQPLFHKYHFSKNLANLLICTYLVFFARNLPSTSTKLVL